MIHSIPRKAAVGLSIVAAVTGAVCMQHAIAAPSSQPADPILHALGLDDAATKARVDTAQGDRAQALVAAEGTCLRNAGFPNAPTSDPALGSSSSGSQPAASADDDELANGFGVTTAKPDNSPADAITQFVAGLSVVDQQRFNSAFNGQNGCAASASKQVMGPLLAAGDAYDKLETQMYNSLSQKPSIKAANAAWFKCMGSPTSFKQPSQISDYLFNKRDALAPGDSAGLQALHDEEMRLASSDVNCRQRFIDPVFVPMLRDAKSNFVSQHGDVLAKLRQALGA